jgi:hypothetical protein
VPATATVNQGDCRPEDDGDEDDPAGHGHRSAEHRRLDEDRPAQLAAVGSDAAQECEGAGALGDEDLERVGDDECRDDECDGSEAQHDRGEHLGPAAELGDLRIRAVRVVEQPDDRQGLVDARPRVGGSGGARRVRTGHEDRLRRHEAVADGHGQPLRDCGRQRDLARRRRQCAAGSAPGRTSHCNREAIRTNRRRHPQWDCTTRVSARPVAPQTRS